MIQKRIEDIENMSASHLTFLDELTLLYEKL